VQGVVCGVQLSARMTTRRSVLKGMAAAAVLLRFARRSEAQAVRPRRLVLFFTPHGAPAEHFWPQSASDYSSSKPGEVSILSPLQKHAAKINVLRGINYVGSNNHPAIRDAFTNKAADSVDSVVAKKLGVKPLRLGVIPDYPQSFTVDGQLSFEGGVARQHNPDPAAAFDALVAGLPAAGGPMMPLPMGPSPSEMRRRALAVADVELAELRARVGGSALAARVEKHQAAVAQLRAPSGTSAPPVIASCMTKPVLPTVEKLRGKNVWAAENLQDLVAAQLDVAAFALRCGLTRVVSIQCGYVNHQVPFPFLGFSEGHHEVSHSSPGGPGRVKHSRCQAWYATRIATLLDALDTPDPEDPAHTILDNTTFLWSSELADGQEHNCEGIPLVLAGGGSGYLKTGQYLQLGGRSHAGLLLSLCEAMGVTGADFGAGTAQGALKEVRL
jgi:hypothetical protein